MYKRQSVRDVETFTVASNSTATYAIVTDMGSSENDYEDGGVQIIDVSNPSAIVAMDAESYHASNFPQLRGAYAADTFMIGTSTYAIVTGIGDWGETAEISRGIQVIDVSNPSAIVATDSLAHESLRYSGGVEVFTIGDKTYAIVTGYWHSEVNIIDLSDPTDISLIDTKTDNSDAGFDEVEGVFGVDVYTVSSSTYAIVTGYTDDGVQIIQISDAGKMSPIGSLANSGSLELDGADGVDTLSLIQI